MKTIYELARMHTALTEWREPYRLAVRQTLGTLEAGKVISTTKLLALMGFDVSVRNPQTSGANNKINIIKDEAIMADCWQRSETRWSPHYDKKTGERRRSIEWLGLGVAGSMPIAEPAVGATAAFDPSTLSDAQLAAMGLVRAPKPIAPTPAETFTEDEMWEGLLQTLTDRNIELGHPHFQRLLQHSLKPGGLERVNLILADMPDGWTQAQEDAWEKHQPKTPRQRWLDKLTQAEEDVMS